METKSLSLEKMEVLEGGVWQFVAGYLGGKLIDGLIYCENNWTDYGNGTYNSLMYKCLTNGKAYGWE
jgi:hypothetical protein